MVLYYGKMIAMGASSISHASNAAALSSAAFSVTGRVVVRARADPASIARKLVAGGGAGAGGSGAHPHTPAAGIRGVDTEVRVWASLC